MNKKALIFDLDGVLVSTDAMHRQAWGETCFQWNIPFSEECSDSLRGVSRMECVDLICRQAEISMSSDERNRFAQEKNKKYIKLLERLKSSDILPGAKSVLCELKNKGMKLAVGSSSKNAVKILEKTGLGQLMDAVIDGNQIHKSKPDPEVFLKAAQCLKLEAKDCVVVEDALSGILAARRGGFMAVGIGDAIREEETDWKIDCLRDLLVLEQVEEMKKVLYK